MTRPVAFITGASSGIGAETARALAAAGYDLILGYGSNDVAAKQLAASLSTRHGVRTSTVGLDLRDPGAAVDAFGAAVSAFGGGLHLFVNNAGVNRRAAVVEENTADWMRVLTVNLTSPFLLAQAAVQRLLTQGTGGRIVNVTSVHEHIPISGGGAYCVSKSGLGMLTKVMALELAGHGITVNAVAPGETATPMNGVPDTVAATDISRPAIPARRPGSPAEVAATVVFLASPAARYTTGTSVVVDGGLSLVAAEANAAHAGRLTPEGAA